MLRINDSPSYVILKRMKDRAAVLVLLVLVGCTPALPTNSPSPMLTGTPSTARATQAVIASHTPVRPTNTATSTPRSDGPDDVWHVVEGFPRAGVTLTTIGIRDPDVVVGGAIASPTAACPKRMAAQIWSSNDGVSWLETLGPPTENAAVDVIANSAYGIPAIGHAEGCSGDGVAVWHPTDKSDWFEMSVSGAGDGRDIVDAVGVGDHFVVAGSFAGDDNRAPFRTLRVNFYEGAVFEPVETPPPSNSNSQMKGLAAMGDLVVAFDGTPTTPAWYSTDGGETWSNSEFQLPHSFEATDAAAISGRFVAVGRSCCGLPTKTAGQVLSSTDGRTWVTALGASPFGAPLEAIVSTPDGWIALGEQVYLSEDGSEWHLGPPLPRYEPRDHVINGRVLPNRLAAATNGEIVVAVTATDVWIARVADLAPADWPHQAPPAEMPQVGAAYDYRLFTHCGPTNGSVQFGFRSWVPDLPEGYFPVSYDSYYEEGTLTFVSDSQLDFTGRGGDVVTYHPTDDPPASFPCA